MNTTLHVISRSSFTQPHGAGAGFTLIELLITIGITVILLAAALPIFSNLQLSAQVNEASSQLVQNLRFSRSSSVSRVNNSSHGIYFDINPAGQDRYIVFQGSSYSVRNTAYDRVTNLDNSLTLSVALTSGVQEVVFSSAFGMPSATGTMTITHITQGARIISLNEIGKTEIE